MEIYPSIPLTFFPQIEAVPTLVLLGCGPTKNATSNDPDMLCSLYDLDSKHKEYMPLHTHMTVSVCVGEISMKLSVGPIGGDQLMTAFAAMTRFLP